jgi:hypothetical protein
MEVAKPDSLSGIAGEPAHCDLVKTQKASRKWLAFNNFSSEGGDSNLRPPGSDPDEQSRSGIFRRISR